MARKPNLAEQFRAEVISYGGFLMTRGDVHTVALEDTGSKQAADLFAFRTREVYDAEPVSIDQFRAETREAA